MPQDPVPTAPAGANSSTQSPPLEAGPVEVRRALLEHPLYSRVSDLPALRHFMEGHVFAVWDFMSLLKRLQRDLTGTGVPWLPPHCPESARLINEIVLAEESDHDQQGRPMSHFDMYLAAMEEVGADRGPVLAFVDALRRGRPIPEALREAEVDEGVAAFVRSTLRWAQEGSTAEVAAVFLHGREDLIPEMFQRLLDRCPGLRSRAPTFVHYLERHIELDGEDHGPQAQALARRLEPGRGESMRAAADAALRDRVALWDRVLESIQEAATTEG